MREIKKVRTSTSKSITDTFVPIQTIGSVNLLYLEYPTTVQLPTDLGRDLDQMRLGGRPGC